LRKLKAELILFFIAVIWAGTFVIIKVTLTDLPPFYFLTFRFFAASVFFYLLVYNRLKKPTKAELKAGLILGILLFAGFASQTSGLVYTTASNSALITGVNLLIVPFAQYFIIKRKVGVENWIGVIVVLAGLFLLTDPVVKGINKGDLITLICAFSWAFYIIYLDVFSRKYNLFVLVLSQFILVTVLSFLFALAFDRMSDIVFSSTSILGLLYTGVLATLVATFLGNKYQKETSPIRAALIFSVEQPGAVILAIIILKDQFQVLQIVGVLLMIGGILFSETFEYFKTMYFKGSLKEENNGTAKELRG
jgi:drug/metabolite transporter (DMT)-like permease